MLETMGINCGDLFSLDEVLRVAQERGLLALTYPTAPSPVHELEPDALLLAQDPHQAGRCWIVGVLKAARYARRDPEHGFTFEHIERFEVPLLVPDDPHHPERVRLVGPQFKAFAPSEFVYLPAGVIEQARVTRNRLKRWYETP